MQNPVGLIASMFALCACVVALIAGASAQNSGAIVLRDAVASMLVAYLIARIVGSVARATVLVPRVAHQSAPSTTHGGTENESTQDLGKVATPQIS